MTFFFLICLACKFFRVLPPLQDEVVQYISKMLRFLPREDCHEMRLEWHEYKKGKQNSPEQKSDKKQTPIKLKRMCSADMQIPKRQLTKIIKTLVKMNLSHYFTKNSNDKHHHTAGIPNADVLKNRSLVHAPIYCICYYVFKSCFTDDHAVILTFLNSSHVDHWFLLPCRLCGFFWRQPHAEFTSLLTNQFRHFLCCSCSLTNCNEQSPHIPSRDKRVQRLRPHGCRSLVKVTDVTLDII